MRSPDDVLQDLEEDRKVRESEVRLIDNLAVRATDEDERTMLHRSLVLLTYAHLEGFCKFALSAYADNVNAKRLQCSAAIVPLVALTLGQVFAALRDINSKHPYFARKLPEDRGLHMVAREQAFVEGYEGVVSAVVEIPERAIDTKSNLTPTVLKKSLFQLGLDYAAVDPFDAAINRLLGMRNAIAHGDRIKQPAKAEVDDYVTTAFDVMRFVQQQIYQALVDESYLRKPAVA